MAGALRISCNSLPEASQLVSCIGILSGHMFSALWFKGWTVSPVSIEHLSHMVFKECHLLTIDIFKDVTGNKSTCLPQHKKPREKGCQVSSFVCLLLEYAHRSLLCSPATCKVWGRKHAKPSALNNMKVHPHFQKLGLLLHLVDPWVVCPSGAEVQCDIPGIQIEPFDNAEE